MAWLCLGLGLSAAAQADCVDGTRDPRPAEREFHDRALAALAAVLPPSPAGVKVEAGSTDLDSLPRLSFLCREQREGAFGLVVRRTYVLAADKAAAQRAWEQGQAIQAQLLELEKLPPEKQAEQRRLAAQSAEIENRRQALLRNKEQAAADAMYRNEIQPLNDAYHRIRTDHQASVKPQADALRARKQALEATDQTVRVAMAVNQARLPAANARPLVGYEGAAAPQQNLGLKVINVAWSVTGTDGPLRDALSAALAVDRLRALVGRPLPAVEQSRASVASLRAPVLPVAPVDTAPVAVAGPAAAAASAAPVQEATAPAGAATAAPPAVPVPTAATAPVAPVAAAPTPTPAPASAPVARPDTVKKAAEGLQKLRGLLGR